MRSIFFYIDHLLAKLGIVFVKGYQYTLKHWLGQQCRFYPTCSYYSIEAFEVHGGVKGAWLTLKRLIRCNPFGGSGVDFVPERRLKINTEDNNKSPDKLQKCHCESS
jgi:hypothetical protein